MGKAASIASLKRRARIRLPGFVYDYLAGGCISDCAVKSNRAALDAHTLQPGYLRPSQPCNLSLGLFGQSFAQPWGMAPIGLSGLIWPGAAEYMARAAASARLPFVLSTVSTTSIERAAELAGEYFWFQLYPPPDLRIRDDLMMRVQRTGCKTLVVTVDVPALGRRPRDIENGLGMPPAYSVRNIFQTLCRPAWALATARNGIPEFANLMPYLEGRATPGNISSFIRSTLKDVVDENVLAGIREQWPHTLIVKGVLTPDDTRRAIAVGADGIWVSNHGGRQLDAAVPTIDVCRSIVDAAGNVPVIADSGVESGVDIVRFLAQGAKMVFSGRAVLYGVAAYGKCGAEQAIEILSAELQQTLAQLRCPTLDMLPHCNAHRPAARSL